MALIQAADKAGTRLWHDKPLSLEVKLPASIMIGGTGIMDLADGSLSGDTPLEACLQARALIKPG